MKRFSVANFISLQTYIYGMAVSEAEKQEVLKAINEGRKISDISEQTGISRDTIRKIKSAGVANPKPDLNDFNKTFDLAGEEKTANELLKAVGNLAPQILKERLDAGELVLNICGPVASAAGIKLEDLLKTLVLLPGQLKQAQADIEDITYANQQLQAEIEKQMDNMVITKAIDRVMTRIMMCGEDNKINLDVLYAYGQFLKKLKTEDLQIFNAYRTLALQPNPQAIAQANPT